MPTISDQPPPGLASASRTERLLAPSVTIALSAVDSAAASIIISPPTERPMPPMRSRIDVGAALEERDGRVDVALALPAEEVRVALALALAAAVEEQHAVAVAREQLRALAAGRPARERDHRRAVPRRDVPALEPQPVARRELRRSRAARRGRQAGRGPCRVRDDVRERDRVNRTASDEEERADGQQQPPPVAPPEASSRRRELHSVTTPRPSSSEPGEDREQPGVVVARRADRPARSARPRCRRGRRRSPTRSAVAARAPARRRA